MEFQAIRCPYCLTEGHLEKHGDLWYCAYCGNNCTDDGAEQVFNKIYAGISHQFRGIIDEKLFLEREERYYNLRSLLWEKIHAKYIDSEAILSVCQDIKKLYPHDFLACFFEVANSGTPDDISFFLNNISIEENGMFVDLILDFTIKSLTSKLVISTAYLIERAYKNRDLKKFEEYTTRLEHEAEKVDSGVYSTMIPRDVFIAYSSKDIDKVIELVNMLEDNGLSCFLAMRNLQHGRGAVANYTSALQSAMNNAKIIVFVSSKNSRNFSCDALTQELRYIREKELSNAPAEYKNDYAALPYKYKKLRVEYRLDNTRSPTDRL